jgi:uncharacterized OB-fold protein
MSPETAKKPRPVPNELTEPFWAASREHRLVIQKCTTCHYYNHPPKPACDNCMSESLEFVPVSGRGNIWSRTILHRSTVPGFDDDVPYVNIAVELDEQAGLLMITNLLDADPDQAVIGARVEVAFDKVDETITLPQFRLAP